MHKLCVVATINKHTLRPLLRSKTKHAWGCPECKEASSWGQQHSMFSSSFRLRLCLRNVVMAELLVWFSILWLPESAVYLCYKLWVPESAICLCYKLWLAESFVCLLCFLLSESVERAGGGHILAWLETDVCGQVSAAGRLLGQPAARHHPAPRATGHLILWGMSSTFYIHCLLHWLILFFHIYM